MDDLKSALRSLRRSPRFAVFAVGTLALGVGVTIAFAAFLDRIILRPVDFPGGDRIMMAWRAREGGGFMLSPDLETRDRVRSADIFDGVVATGSKDVAWSTDDGPRMLDARLMDTGLPVLAGLPPLLGRYFTAEDLAGAGAPVALLSEGLWKQAFGADPGVIGRTLRLDGNPVTVIGVAPENLRAPGPGNSRVDVWLPLPADNSQPGVTVIGRLREGVTLDQANERMKALDLAAAESKSSEWSTKLVSLSYMVSARLKNPLKVAGVAVALLLLIACLNVANLFLARGGARLRDTAVRSAVGAGSVRLARELLFEALLVAGAASALGIGFAAVVLDVARRLRPEELHLLDSLHLDPGITAAAVGAAVLTVLLFGSLPLLHRIRTRPGAVLTERSATSDGDAVAMRRLLLIGEVALSFALLAGGVQIVSTLAKARARDPGVAASELLAVRLSFPEWRFPDATAHEATLTEIRDRVRALPGVEDVTLASGAPTRFGVYFGAAEAQGEPAPEGDKGTTIFFDNTVEPGYFDTVGQRVVQGRAFTAADVGATPTPYVLGESAAARYFPDGGAVGGLFKIEGEEWHPVIGVVNDIWSTGSTDGPGYPQMYLPRDPGDGGVMLVRADDPSAVAAQVRSIVRAVDAEIPILDMQPVSAMYAEALARERLIAMLLAAFAVAAALLAAVGLYGVVAQLALSRTREFGIRVSLGADRRSIFRLALRGGTQSVALGLGVGVALAWAGLRFLKAGVAGLTEAQPLAFLAAGALLALVTLAAMGVPAARAAKVDPTEALRAE